MVDLSKVNKPIFAKLLKRFSSAQAGAKSLFIGDTIVPVLDVSELTYRMNSKWYNTTAVSGGTTLTVPEGKQYLIKTIWVRRASAGVIEFTILTPNGLGTSQQFYSQPATATEVNWNAPDTFLLNTGDELTVQCAVGTSGLIQIMITYIEVDA